MKVLEFVKGLPSRVGDIDIKYGYTSDCLPGFKEHELVVPLKLGIEIYPICNNMQILIKTTKDPFVGRCYFGGTDNSPERTPFLTEINPNNFVEYENEGEDAFYDSLIPDEIKFFSCHPRNNQFQKQLFKEEGLQKHPNIIKRQGDIFAVPFPHEEEELMTIIGIMGKGKYTIDDDFEEAEGKMLFSTRHSFNGFCLAGDDFVIGEGRVSAPDHLPLVLKGLHLIMRASGLLNKD